MPTSPLYPSVSNLVSANKFRILCLMFFVICNYSCNSVVPVKEKEKGEECENKNAKFETLLLKYELKYDKINVLAATLFISPYFREKYYEISGIAEMSATLDDGWFAFDLPEFYDENADALEMDKYLSDCDFAHIERWKLMNEKLYSVPVSRDEGVDVEFSQIIYYMKNGEKFYKDFINKSIGQYYGSLGTTQRAVFVYNVLYYLTYADSDAEEEFFLDYFETFENLTKAPLYYEKAH